MSRVNVPFDEHFSRLCRALRSGGALLVSLDENHRPNAMTIGWAQLGIIWGKWICTVLVRPSRYTWACCNATGDFTVNVPYPAQAEAVLHCGTHSGRDTDKFAQCGFTPSPAHSPTVASPYIAQCGLALECTVVHTNEVLAENLAAVVAESCYPHGDYHRCYAGEVLAAHADPDFAIRFDAGE